MARELSGAAAKLNRPTQLLDQGHQGRFIEVAAFWQCF
jgi:hypothetical protein